MYVCRYVGRYVGIMVITCSRLGIDWCMVANPAHGQLNRENELSPVLV